MSDRTQLSSPIRRFADLVMQRQLAASLEGREPPYVAEELLRVLSAAQDVEREARDVETRAVRARVIEYLESERREDELEVVVVRRQGAGAVVETRDLYIRGTLMSAGEYSPGDSVSVRIDRIDPGKDILIFRPVEPAASKE